MRHIPLSGRFVNGKTLADGFYFVSKTQGIERTLQNEDALHQISAKVGTRTDITVTRWNAYLRSRKTQVK